MGFLGLLISVLFIILLTGGYFLFDAMGNAPTVTVKNDSVPTTEQSISDILSGSGGISRYEAVKEKALDVKSMVENRAAETMSEESSPLQTSEGRSEESTIRIIDKKVNFGFEVPASKRTIDTVVLHSSYDPEGKDPYSVSAVMKIWEGYGVAPHYMIDRKGSIYRLVDDANIAFHAGVSKMPDGRTDVNTFSIGIEILNTKEDKMTDAQYTAINNLLAYLKDKYTIKNVVGHTDIAPGRKDDPWNFDWKRLR